MSGWANYDAVRRQLEAAGLIIDGPLRLATGERSERCFVGDDRREKRGWYYIHEWHIEPGVVLLVGSYGIFYGDNPNVQQIALTKVCANCGADVGLRDKKCHACDHAQFKAREFTAEQRAAFKAARAEDRKRAAAAQRARADRAAQWATAVWRACAETTPGGHPYLLRKHLTITGGARIFSGNDHVMLAGGDADDYKYLATFVGSLVVPLTDGNGKIHGLQFIAEKADPKTGRDKTYWPAGMAVLSHSWLIGGAPGRLLLIAEGFATAATLHEATGQPVAVAFAANNLLPVAKDLNERGRKRSKLLICADDDWLQHCRECNTYTPVSDPTCRACGKPHRQRNAGVDRAADIVMAIPRAAAFVPQFAAERQLDRKGPTDFNDLRAVEGPQAVVAQYQARLAELKWQDLAADAMTTPHPVPPPAGQAPRADSAHKGGGAKQRPPALATMDLDDLVERFIPIDDGTGDYIFDTWTRKLAKRSQMLTLLQAGQRNEDIKRHHKWQSRGAYYLDQIGFDPAGDDPAVALNTWQGWPMQPQSGSCQYLLDLIYYLCSNDKNADGVYTWLLQWMAYPLQHPGAKMHSAVIMHGPQGTGKSTAFQTLAQIYGDYATVLNQRGLEDKFNADWTDSKLFILAEEVVSRAEMWHIKNELKELVTGTKLRVNPKGIAAYYQRNHINVAYSSNADQPLPLENDDRRHCVIYTPPELSEERYDEVQIELENGGVAAFYHHLLHLDLTGFHPRKRPPMTEAKKALILLSAQSDTRFLGEWLDGDLGLPVCPCLATDLYAEYLRWCRANGEKNPRNSAAFYGAITNLPGWAKKKERIFETLTSTDQIVRPIVTPPTQHIDHEHQATPDQKEIAWRTACAIDFTAALNRRGHDTG